MPFKPGQSGNPAGRARGSKDKTPRSFRALVRHVIGANEAAVKKAFLEGITGKDAHRYLAIAASLEKQQHEVSGPEGGPIQVHDHFSLPAAS